MTRLQIPLQGKTCGKKRWYDRRGAEGHRQALESWERVHGRPALDQGELNIYYCAGCGAWHVGHKPA